MSPPLSDTEVKPRRASVDALRLRRPIDQMTPDELCAEAGRLREGISSAVEQLQGVYAALYHHVRRSPADDSTHAYITFANAGKRLTGMVLQGLRRSSAFDRVLFTAKKDAEDRARREKEALAKKEAREMKKQTERDQPARPEDPLGLFGSPDEGFEPMIQQLLSGSSSSDDLDDLFGEDI